MLSLRSILLAAAAFATFTSAIPTTGNPLGGGDATGVIGSITDGLTSGGGGTNALSGIPPAKRGFSQSCGDIFQKCHDGIAVIVVELTAAVNCDGGAKKVDHKYVISLLGEIVVLLKVALGELKLIVHAELLLKGVVCTLQELAEVVVGLIILIVEVLYLVLTVVGFLDVTLCGVIATIGVLLCELLTLVFVLVDGLLVLVADLFVSYGGHCKFIEFSQVLAILKIAV